MKKGFKTWCENKSVEIRQGLGIHAHGPLPYDVLAQHMRIPICSADGLPLPRAVKHQLFVSDKRSWSALSVPIEDSHVVLFNPTTTSARRTSSIMHELAHVIRDHKTTKFYTLRGTDLRIRNFDPEQEEEADWLGGCLLLPRTALLHALRKRLPNTEIQAIYGVSAELLRMRINKTGVKKQLGIK